MFTVFFNGTEERKIVILPERQKMNRTFLGGRSTDFLQTVFQELVWRLQLFRDGGEECVALTLQNGTFTFVISRIGDVSPGQH
jgi:hypothetical protein